MEISTRGPSPIGMTMTGNQSLLAMMTMTDLLRPDPMGMTTMVKAMTTNPPRADKMDTTIRSRIDPIGYLLMAMILFKLTQPSPMGSTMSNPSISPIMMTILRQ